MMSESLVEKLLIEIDSIKARTKNIKVTLKYTNNRNLKFRLKKEFRSLLNRLVDIQNISSQIYNSNKNQICLSALLEEKCKRIKFEIYSSKELFLT